MANLADVLNSVGRIIISCWAFLISLIGFGAEFQNLITYIDHFDGHPRRYAATPNNDTPPDDAAPNSNASPNDAAPNSNTPPASPPDDEVLFNATLWQTFTSAMEKSHENLRLVAFLQLPVLGFISLSFACPALFASILFLSKFGVIAQGRSVNWYFIRQWRDAIDRSGWQTWHAFSLATEQVLLATTFQVASFSVGFIKTVDQSAIAFCKRQVCDKTILGVGFGIFVFNLFRVVLLRITFHAYFRPLVILRVEDIENNQWEANMTRGSAGANAETSQDLHNLTKGKEREVQPEASSSSSAARVVLLVPASSEERHVYIELRTIPT